MVIAYKELFRTGNHIYYGPTMVDIGAVMYIENELVTLFRLRNMLKVGVNGIVAISLAIMYMITDVKEVEKSIRTSSEPKSLLQDFMILDIDEQDEKELEKQNIS
ncbi:unnamed protein product [Microthlaspi erraticum]|uniref:Uncharacterized protein n=1 Tax=Microthlaspi erraticum TaxID=1685480 RepID=A0A6D2JRI8_9BRAS|nr:unnamed protein product [Microthlaspi erraticum]